MSQPDPIKQWTDIDSKDASRFQSYLSQVSALDGVKRYKQQTFSALEISSGHHILDVGCGNGDDVRSLARLVGDEGLVVGVEKSEELIEGARNSGENLSLPVMFVVGDGHNLDFADETFNAARADRVFQHVPDRKQVLSEMIRVTRPHGWIVVADPDWETLVVDHPGNRTLTRKVLNHVCDNYATHGWAARQSYRLFKQAGLQEVAASSVTTIFTEFSIAGYVLHLVSVSQDMVQAGYLTAKEAAGWLEALQLADQQGYFFSALSGFIVRGRKP